MSDLKEKIKVDDMRGFLHRHPKTEMDLGLDSNHCIVDIEDWKKARKQANVDGTSENSLHIQNVTRSFISWGVIENIVTILAIVGLFIWTKSAWSFLLLLNINSFKTRKD